MLGLRWEKLFSPAYTVLRVWLEPGERVVAEAGAFLLARGEVEVETSVGGIVRGLKRALLGGESLFLNTYTAKGRAELWFVPRLPGDVEAIELSGDEWYVQDASYLAHYGDIKVSTKMLGVKGLFAEGELFWLKVSGTGVVWVNGFGAIEVVEVEPGETITVDNYHLVAMPSDTEYRIRRFGGKWRSFLFGGEGFVLEVEGPTKLIIQTHILPPLAQLIAKFLPEKR